VEAAGKYEYHICEHGTYVFPEPCCRHDYHLHEGDSCSCSVPFSRFKKDSNGRLHPHTVGVISLHYLRSRGGCEEGGAGRIL
jgi:hypothetical protein